MISTNLVRKGFLMKKKLTVLILSLIMAVGSPTAITFAANGYTEIDIDAWDYDRTEELKNQVSVHGEVEYEPPDSVSVTTGGSYEFVYPESVADDMEVVSKTSQAAITVSQPAIVSAEPGKEINLLLGIIIIGASLIVGVVVTIKRGVK